MRRLFYAALLALTGIAAPAAAQAATGYTTGNVNLRAGPGTQYPRVLVVPAGAPVAVFGCLQGYTWCDVEVDRERGWISARYLSIFYDEQQAYVPYRPRVVVPRVTFGFGYWDRWYTDRPWYRDWDRPHRRDWDRARDRDWRRDRDRDWNRDRDRDWNRNRDRDWSRNREGREDGGERRLRRSEDMTGSIRVPDWLGGNDRSYKPQVRRGSESAD